MERIEELFNEHFTFDKAEMEKGFTMWTLTPKRETKLAEEGNEDV
jgi:hypothetical protein